ncbi:SMI1/KNR4 family protein [Streptomyces apricus]|uniref:SMI1/KNR4 family protein n=1 Tax=Streptomyces apricus TaxID=1828112 RepID=UPI001F436455|nr:SMI1/KNR4 family protein [Streptomyces apricus]
MRSRFGDFADGPEAGTAAERLRTVEQWRSYLAEYGADVLRVSAEGELLHVSDEQRATGWLGHEGAHEQRIAAVEERLGTRLPPSYRSFLGASDGWSHPGPFMYEMRTTGTLDWLDDDDAEMYMDMYTDAYGDEADETDDASEHVRAPVLLVADEGDAQVWLLDSGDVSQDGEWAAYTWSSWQPGLSERYGSFAELVAAERASFERLKGYAGSAVHPEGAEQLVAEGRAQALRGEAERAVATFGQAAVKGSGAGAYLAVVLGAFLDLTYAHHEIRNGVLARPHVIEAVGLEQVRAEAVALYLRRTVEEYGPKKDFSSVLVPELRMSEGGPVVDWIPHAAASAPPVLPESPLFQEALDTARTIALSGAPGACDDAWAVIETALPHWHCESPHRIAPVVLLTDPAFREVVTASRARLLVTTPRGGARERH